MRAYSLQMQNSLDTVDANRFLGFLMTMNAYSYLQP
ncbi:hypothetical protein [Anaplasma phagocytophilum]|nr:hypothetical protein [Anaplasma phagocytophilum]